ncbi:MAG: lysylphosphatidylglycerol synthase transmembrane domain-containing protein [Solirubrobacteraceae bacterium]
MSNVDTGTPSTAPTAGPGADGSSTGPSGRKSFLARHRRIAASLLGGALVFGFVYYVVPQIVGFGPTLERLRAGNLWWLGLGVPLEALSYGAYIVLFHGVFSRLGGRIGWWVSYQITLAGGGATKLFAAAGSGGVAVTVWALRASGLASAEVAQGMVCFEILNYAVYMAALAIAGFGLWIGLFVGKAPFVLTLVPALFGLTVIVVVLSMKWLASPAQSYLLARAKRSHGRAARRWTRAARFPRALQDGLRSALALVRSGDLSWLGAIPAWGFDIGTLWVSFRAFGHSPPAAVLVMGYYVGTLGNMLPIPGGIGGVEGGMIGAFLGFGVNGSLAVLAVLAYRTISYWLPALPEGGAYLHLRGTVGDWREHASQASPRGSAQEAPRAEAEQPATGAEHQTRRANGGASADDRA